LYYLLLFEFYWRLLVYPATLSSSSGCYFTCYVSSFRSLN